MTIIPQEKLPFNIEGQEKKFIEIKICLKEKGAKGSNLIFGFNDFEKSCHIDIKCIDDEIDSIGNFKFI